MSTAKIKNTTSSARTGIVTLGIPFTRAENLQVTDTLVVSGALTGNTNQKIQWYPQGIRWDNGAIKYARASFRTDLTGNEEKTVTIDKSSTSTSVPFNINPALASAFYGTIFEFTIQNQIYTIPMLEVITRLIEGGGPTDHYARFRYFTHLPPAAFDAQIRHIWVELVVESYSDLNHIQFYFRFGYYRFDPSVPAGSGVDPNLLLTSPVTLRIQNAASKIRWEDQKIPFIQDISAINRLYTLINPFVAGKANFPIGTSNCYKGVLIYDASSTSIAEAEAPILAMSENWKTFYPITGIMPPRPSYITSDSDAYNRSQSLLNALQGPMLGIRDPYNWPTICPNPDTTSTGSHGARDYAFGLRGWPFLSTCNYNWIPMLEFSTRQQAVRCNWFYDDFGEPVSPTQFSNISTIMFNGTFFTTTRGYTRTVQTNDYHKASPITQNISGPDKQHYTNKMNIIQGLVTMDWFSLEFGKMYSKYWIHANRTDGNLFVASLDAPRGAGRVSEVAAFLYEFYADPELKFWVHRRQDDNLNKYDHQAVNKTAYPGGIEVLRPLFRLGPCNQGACLGPLEHWRPWEESQASFGYYLLGNCLLSEDPTNVRAARMVEISKDIAGSVTLYGYKDGRTTSNRRFFTLFFNTAADCTAFYNAIGAISNNVSVLGLTNGGTGTIYLAHSESDVGAQPDRSMRIELTNATGFFQVGEVVRLRTGHTASIGRTWTFDGGAKSYSTLSVANGYLRALSDSELLEQTSPGAEPQYPVSENGTPRFPFGGSKYTRWYYLYGYIQSAALMIAREAAKQGFYSDNPTVLSKANDLLNYYYTSEFNQDNGDYEETLLSYIGYIAQEIIDTGVIYVNPLPCSSESSAPAPTVVITNQSVSAIANADSSLIIYSSLAPTVYSTSSTSTIVSAPFSSIGFTSERDHRINNLVTTATSSIGYYPSEVSSIFTSTFTLNNRIFTYIYIGKETGGSTLPGVDEGGGTPGEEEGEKTPFYYHRVLLLQPIDLSGSVAIDYYQFTDYVLLFPITLNSPYRGEILKLPGQTMRSEGYTYYIGSEATTRFDTTSYVLTESSIIRHYIDVANKGGFIRSWRTAADGTYDVSWLRNRTLLDGISVNEDYIITDGSSTVRFNPNFNGANSLDTHSLVSPPLYSKFTEFRDFYLIEGAVTPLESDSYGSLSALQSHGGAYDAPLIARDMKQYYSVAINKNGEGINQIEAWSFHQYGVPIGNHTSLSNNLLINFIKQFDELYLYNMETREEFYLSYLLGTTSFTLYIGTDSIKAIIQTDPVQEFILPSYVREGKAAIIARSSKNGMTVGFAAKLETVSNKLASSNVIIFERYYYKDLPMHGQVTSRTGDKIGISSLIDPVFTDETIQRVPGWIGQRAYIIFDTSKQNVTDKLQALNQNPAFLSKITSPGLFPYERPAII